jgi:hypothetical protein
MSRILPAALAYFGVIFAAGFVLGTFRVVVMIPRFGDLASVALEVPVMLALSWLVAGWVLRRWPVAGTGARAGMGALAFAFLMAAEVALSVTLFGRSFGQFLAELATPHGALGLAGQIGFALMPALRR